MKDKSKLKFDVSRKIRRNTAFNILGGGWNFLVLLALIPYIIGHLGAERYGVWVIVSIFTGYLGFLDFGINVSLVKHISEFLMKKDYRRINQVINTGLIFCIALAIPIITFGIIILEPLISLFKISPHLHEEALFVFLLGMIIFGMTTILSTFKAVQRGFQRMDITNSVRTLMTIPMIAGTIFFLENGYGLPGLVINTAIILILGGVIDIIIVFKIFPELKFSPALFDKQILKRLFEFGGKMQITNIATFIHFQMDKFLLAHFLHIQSVIHYEVAANFASKVKDIPSALISAILPAVSGLDINTDNELLHKIYSRSLKYVVLISFPLLALTLLLAHPFINLWLGQGYEKSVLTLQILLTSYMYNIMTGPGFTILNGIGKPNYGVKSSLLASILNLIISITLIIKLGFFGAVYGTALSIIIAATYFILVFHKVMQISLFETIYNITLKPCMASVLSYILTFVVLKQLSTIGWLDLAGLAVVFLTIFTTIIMVLRYFDDFDKDLISKYTHGVISKFTKNQ